jgi:hypothetical protein
MGWLKMRRMLMLVVSLLIRLEEEVQVVSSKHPKLPKMYEKL